MLSEKMAELTMAQSEDEDDPLLGSFLIVVAVAVVVVVTAGGAPVHAAAVGAAPDANKGEPKGAHHGNSFVLGFMAAWRVRSSSWWWWPWRRAWKDGCHKRCDDLGLHWGGCRRELVWGEDVGIRTKDHTPGVVKNVLCRCGGRRGT